MRYHNITNDDMLNGEGLRVVLWLSGCEHACPECHNEETWSLHGGLNFDEEAKKELFQKLAKDHISGITLSGGDPLHVANRQDVEALINEIHETFPTKTIWLYTGYNFDEIKKLTLLNHVDVVVDGKFDKDLKDERMYWCGSSNQKVIDVKESLNLDKVVLHNI